MDLIRLLPLFLALTSFSALASPLGSSHRPREIRVENIPRGLEERPWTQAAIQMGYGNRSIEFLFKKLAESKIGLKLIEESAHKAFSENMNLGVLTVSNLQEEIAYPQGLVLAGDGSLLDTTLLRRFSRDNPLIVEYEIRSQIYINRHHNLRNALMDLAHELTHYIHRLPFNPYEKNFTPEEFLKNTIEATGGEAHAFLTECQVLQELFPSHFLRSSQCQSILDEKGNLSFNRAVESFYRLGKHFREYQKQVQLMRLKQEGLPSVSAQAALFISSAWGLPYPLAALKEYSTIMEKVCQNDQRRLGLMESSRERSPASLDQEKLSYLINNHQTRCGDFLTLNQQVF